MCCGGIESKSFAKCFCFISSLLRLIHDFLWSRMKHQNSQKRSHTHTCTPIVRLFIEFNLKIYYTLSKLMFKFLFFANSFVIRVCFHVFTYFEFPPLLNYSKKCFVTFLNVNLINNERSHEQFNISMLWSITNP